MDKKKELLDDILEILDVIKGDIEKQKKLLSELEKYKNDKYRINEYKKSITSLRFAYIALDSMRDKQIKQYIEMLGLNPVIKIKK